MTSTNSLIRHSHSATVIGTFEDRVRAYPDRPALQRGELVWSFTELDRRVTRLAHVLGNLGIVRGDRIAILSENRPEYVEAVLACARVGAILACQNWRLAVPELRHCISMVTPSVILVSARHRPKLDELALDGVSVLEFEKDYEDRLADASTDPIQADVDPEDGLLILYTSGTTGLPKGALISHRAEVARAMAARSDFLIAPGDTMAVWMPLFHMGGMDYALTILTGGGKVIVEDGYDPDRLAAIAEREPLGWFIVIPGMVESMIETLKRRKSRPKAIRLCGAMADLVPAHQIAEITRLLNAPYANTFGSTEAGSLPADANPIAIGAAPDTLSKRQSPHCEMRLLDEEDNDVPIGVPGELAMRGPTLFSGYWNDEETNARDFRGGWFHNGDLLVRHADGGFDFVDRKKYMIKSGGENIYPAEIERVLLSDPRLTEAAVVRRADDRWGEVPIAFVARSDETVSADDLHALCRANLAGFKQPKDIRFLDHEAFPRNVSGKILRHDLEAMLGTS
jgi:acyl-CoA synthetase (AMP-forming)/AMP-acid ligase II